MQPKDKKIFRNKSVNTIHKQIPDLIRSYLEFCFTHSLEQIIANPTSVTDPTATLADHILANTPEKVSQSGVIDDLGLSDHGLIYCTRKTSLPKSHKHNEIFVRSIKGYSAEKVLEILRQIVFPSYLNYPCANNACSDFIYRFVRTINFIAPAKSIREKANSKPWFGNETVSAIHRRDKLYKKFKQSGLEIDKDNLKVAKMYLQKIVLKKTKSYLEEELNKNRNKPKELKVSRLKFGQSKEIKNLS